MEKCGKIASTTHQYGSEYVAESTLFGRDAAHGGLPTDNNGKDDGIILKVFLVKTLSLIVDVSGLPMRMQLKLKASCCLDYYEGIASWGTGIREYSVMDNTGFPFVKFHLATSYQSRSRKAAYQQVALKCLWSQYCLLVYEYKRSYLSESIYSSRPGI
jgi:hypothetical protein